MNLTKRDYDILNSLWNSDKPMSINDILNSNRELTHSTVSLELKKMLKEGLIEIIGTVRSGKVLSRTYRPTQLSKDLILEKFSNDYKEFDNIISASDLCSSILKLGKPSEAKKEINRLKKILESLEE